MTTDLARTVEGYEAASHDYQAKHGLWNTRMLEQTRQYGAPSEVWSAPSYLPIRL